MALSHGTLKIQALTVIGDDKANNAFTPKQLVEANNWAMTEAAKTLGLTYLEKTGVVVDLATGKVPLGTEVITTMKVILEDIAVGV